VGTFYEGKTYNIYVRSSAASYHVYVKEGGWYVKADQDYFSLEAGETAPLSVTVKASEDCKLTYSWAQKNFYNYAEEEISGATTSEYTTDQDGLYILTVSDGTKTVRQKFTVTVNSGLAVEEDPDTSLTLEPGAQQTFEVNATTEHGTLQYQWYQQYKSLSEITAEEMIEGATSPNLTVTIPSARKADEEEYMIYHCVITDGYNTTHVSYDVSLQECDHQMITVVDQSASCGTGTAGVQHRECTICHMKETPILVTKNHEYGEYVVTTSPTVSKTGVKTRTCKNCGHSDSATIDRLQATTSTSSASSTGVAAGASASSSAVTTITASDFTRTYSAKAQTFSIGAKSNSKGKITYSSNNKSVKVNSAGKVTIKAKFIGKATITVKVAASGSYKSASKQITITVNPAKTSISSLSNTKGKKMTVKWKKNAACTGYQIQYSTDKNFKTGVKTVKVAKSSTTSKTIAKLKKGKTYYVRVRTYKTVSKENYYSGWSKVKKIKVSK
jgi:hypothetical protein